MELKLTFLGGSGNVTGSRYLLETASTRVLVDCGLYQERQFLNRNWEPFTVAPASLDAVLLTHAHVDHCGLIPKLVREGFHGRIYCTTATAELAEIILLDSAKLQVEDAEFKRKRHEREGRRGTHPEVPLYTVDDARNSFPFFSPVEYEQLVPVSNDVQASFHDAGHVLGSAMIKIRVAEGSQSRTVLFSGDVGRFNMPILKDPTRFQSLDYVVIESTYGDRLHPATSDIKSTLAEVISSTEKAGGNIIIPSFALERAQELLYYMKELLAEDRIPHIMVFLDSPMAVSITRVFERHPEFMDDRLARLLRQNKSPFDFPGLKMVETTDESKAINHISGTIMVIAGAGMCNGGRIKHHLVTNISRPESTILFVGYQAMGTLGRQIVDGNRKVRILGKEYPVRARVAQINGFSAHADRDGLYEWISALSKPPRRLFVTHGESATAQSFGEYLRGKTGWAISCPEYGTVTWLD